MEIHDLEPLKNNAFEINDIAQMPQEKFINMV
jgi:hypothetical protein